MPKRRDNYTTSPQFSGFAPQHSALLSLVFVYGTTAPTVPQIMDTIGCSRATAYRIRRSYCDRLDVFKAQIHSVHHRLQFTPEDTAHA